jgi:hypothetical protein
MRFAYADPPYLGCCGLYSHHHPDGKCWNDEQTHRDLFARLQHDFPDGWALSASSPSLATLLPMAPPGTRIAAWVKSFCAFKRGVRPCYAWEPVLFFGGRNPPAYRHPPPEKGGKQTTPKDFHMAPITLKKGLTGAKPASVCDWILDLLGYLPGDEMVDLFPGTGIMTDRATARSELQGEIVDLILEPVEKMPSVRGRRGENQEAAAKIMTALEGAQGTPLLAARGSRHKMDSVRTLLKRKGAEAVVAPTDDPEVFELTAALAPF